MNVIAGLIIGIIAATFYELISFSFYWAVIHVVYGVVFKLHDNPVVNSSRSGNPVLSYYFTRFIIGFMTSVVISIIVFSIMSIF